MKNGKMLENEKLDELLLHYPGITAVEPPLTSSTNVICLQGTVKVQNTWYRLNLKCPNFPQLNEMLLSVQIGHKMLNLTSESNGVQSNWTIYDLIKNLPNLLNVESKNLTDSILSAVNADNTTIGTTTSTIPAHQNLFAEIVDIYSQDSSYRVDVNDNCTRIRFSNFIQYEQHYLELDLKPSFRLRQHSLPDCVPWQELLEKQTSLKAILQQFQRLLEDLRPFYENFADIDELCYVVQPSPPTTKDNWRLFPLRERVYLKLIITDPFAPIASMDLHIIGPTLDLTELRRVYSEGLNNWDVDLDIHKNLLRIFNLCYFPMAPSNGGDNNNSQDDDDGGGQQQYCNICYCWQLEHGEIPIVSCDNSNCCLIFHAACLKEWFNTLTNGKDFLSVSLGACPFCKTKLSTSFAELLEN